jgi:voltage-gated potassium channel
MKELEKHLYHYVVAFVIFIIAFGTIFYRTVEGFSWVDAYYFCITTLSTVGYGDVTPETTIGKLFTTFYIMLGIGTFSAFITLTVKRRQSRYKERRASKVDQK